MSSLRASIDGLQTEVGPRNGAVVALAGEPLVCTGWACRVSSEAEPVAVNVLVDDRTVTVATTRWQRPDVAEFFGRTGVTDAGFRVEIPTAQLPIGMHEFVLEFGDAHGESIRSNAIPFEVAPRVALERMQIPRVLIAAAPKSGCTYVAAVLAHYYRVESTGASFFPYAEHMLDSGVLGQIEGKSWVLPMHVWPRIPNLAAICKQRISTVVTWRNLADAIVSFDDHLQKEWGGFGGGPEVYIGARDRWQAVPTPERYAFLVRNLTPWYVGFYRAWRDVGAPTVMAYERLATDPKAYFSYLIERLSGEVNEASLEQALNAVDGTGRDYGAARRNVGVNGRAVELMPDETKQLLEDLLKSQFDDVSELLLELPWRGGADAAIVADPARWMLGGG